jgi:hypothetical protein
MGDPQLGVAERPYEAVLLSVLSDVKDGDFSVRMPLGWTGVGGKIADDAGASAYVSKSVESADLLLVLGEWVAPEGPAGRSPAEVC